MTIGSNFLPSANEPHSSPRKNDRQATISMDKHS
jgi:hypothetical protein